MLFAGKRTARTGFLAAVCATTALGLATSGAVAQSQDTCSYDPNCSTYTPGSGTQPTAAQSGRAALEATHKCTKTSFPVTVSGRSMRRVTIYVNGRLAKRIAVKSTATRVVSKLPTPVATSKIVVKVTFSTASGTASKTFARTVRRCVPAAVSPNFTG